MREHLAKSKAILEAHGIDWFKGRENLVWAPNAGHSTENARRVYEALEKANQSGCRNDIVEALRIMGEHFANGTINSLP